jgi:hypothetical protein
MDREAILRSNVRVAKRIWGRLPAGATDCLKELTHEHNLSVAAGEILMIDGRWYITHSGLLRIARRCSGIEVEAVGEFCDPAASRYAFKATLYKSRACKGFVGYGDADPSNVSPLVHGAEMRVAETRAVNRALRKAYGIGICSVEELGSTAESRQFPPQAKKPPVQAANGNGGSKVRDRLCQIIRQHQLDANLVKSISAGPRPCVRLPESR